MEYLPDGSELSSAGNDLFIAGASDGGIIDSVASAVGDLAHQTADSISNVAGDLAGGDIISAAADLAIPFPVGLAVGLGTRKALVERGVDPNTAKWCGRAAGWATSLCTIWAGAP